MNPRPRPSDQEAIEASAAAWLAQRDAGFSVDEARAFAQWCADDPRHAAAVARLETTWLALHELRNFRPDARAHPDPDLLAPARRRRVFRFPTAAVLATAAAAAILAVVFLRSPRLDVFTPNATQSYNTTAGGYQRLTLADGSVVELNANTEVRVHYTDTERQAFLLRGEAHFTVASNPRRPFWVEAGNIAVRAVGTAFNVRRDAREVEVLVTAGRVQVNRNAAPLALNAGAPLLAAGWRAVISTSDPTAPRVEQLGFEPMRQALAWQSSRLVFVDTPLSEVIEEFNRRNQVQVSLGDPALASIPIGGSFGAENVESFIRLLSSNGDIRVERPAPDRIVLRRP